MTRANAIWYGDASVPWHWRLGSYLFFIASQLRGRAFAIGLVTVHRLSCPVIVIGNITAGGTGKTPLVLWLAERLQMAGYRPGIISRGYGGSYSGTRLVSVHSDPAEVGDEAVMCAMRSGLPVAVAKQRWKAGQSLIDETGVNVLISDDGLQHYALARDVEICVIDGQRRFGNGLLFPAGPLREPIEQLERVDFVVTNGDARDGEIEMQLDLSDPRSLSGSERRTLDSFRGERVHAVAGIGNPGRFFNQLRSQDIKITEHEFPDHHTFTLRDLDFNDNKAIFMTEKDAVKCTALKLKNTWVVPVTACLPDNFKDVLLARLAGMEPGVSP